MADVDDNEFWVFSLRVYEAPAVEAECLAMQDAFGIDVNLLLFCAWLAAERGIALNASDLQNCETEVSEWHDRAVRPLRAARRAMKGLAEAENIRAQVKILELTAERLEQELLHGFAMRRWPARAATTASDLLRSNVDLFLRAHGAPGADAVPALLAAAT